MIGLNHERWSAPSHVEIMCRNGTSTRDWFESRALERAIKRGTVEMLVENLKANARLAITRLLVGKVLEQLICRLTNICHHPFLFQLSLP